jgi:hypothetical protein
MKLPSILPNTNIAGQLGYSRWNRQSLSDAEIRTLEKLVFGFKHDVPIRITECAGKAFENVKPSTTFVIQRVGSTDLPLVVQPST